MTPTEYTAALTTLGLTTEQAAKWLGIGRSTAFRYAVDGAPGSVARALGVAAACAELQRLDVWTIGEISPSKSLPDPNGDYVRHSDLIAAVGLPTSPLANPPPSVDNPAL